MKKAIIGVLSAVVLLTCTSENCNVVKAAEADEMLEMQTTERCDYRQPSFVTVPWDESETVTGSRKRISASESAYWSKFSGEYIYSQLSTGEKQVWDAFEEQCISAAVGTATMEAVTVSFNNSQLGLTNDEMFDLLMMFRMANPQYYFLTNTMALSYSGTQYIIGIEIFPDFQDGTSRSSATNAFKNQVDAWVSQVSAGARDEDKVKIAHDIVAQNTVYGDVVDNYGNYLDQSAYSMVCVGQTVCAGYAQTFEMLLNAVGIECIEATSTNHAWNLVQIHGNWYEVDVTWDDQEDSYGEVIYAFYDKSNATMRVEGNHVYEDCWSGILPVAIYDSVEPANPYGYESAYFTVGSNTYFKVNSNEALANCLALPVSVGDSASVPATVTCESTTYQVIGAENSGTSSGEPEDTNNGTSSGEVQDTTETTTGEMRLDSDGRWHYYRNGTIDRNYTGMACNEYGWWYFANGELVWDYTGMALNEYGWWYFSNGQLDWGYTGMALNEYGWWYFSNGQLDWGYTGMALNEYGWWYFSNGQLDWGYTGMALNEYGWWYFTNGQLDWNYTGWGYNEYGQWWFENGRIVL